MLTGHLNTIPSGGKPTRQTQDIKPYFNVAWGEWCWILCETDKIFGHIFKK